MKKMKKIIKNHKNNNLFTCCQGEAYERFLPLVCGHHIRPGNFKMLSRLNKSDLRAFF